MRFVLEIELGNTAMQDGDHVALVLREVARLVDLSGKLHPGAERYIRDVNGNTVGRWVVEA